MRSKCITRILFVPHALTYKTVSYSQTWYTENIWELVFIDSIDLIAIMMCSHVHTHIVIQKWNYSLDLLWNVGQGILSETRNNSFGKMTIKWQKNIGHFKVYKTKSRWTKEKTIGRVKQMRTDQKEANNKNRKATTRMIINQIGRPYAVLHQCSSMQWIAFGFRFYNAI